MGRGRFGLLVWSCCDCCLVVLLSWCGCCAVVVVVIVVVVVVWFRDPEKHAWAIHGYIQAFVGSVIPNPTVDQQTSRTANEILTELSATTSRDEKLHILNGTNLTDDGEDNAPIRIGQH